MMGGTALLSKAKMQTVNVLSTCWAEVTELFNVSTDRWEDNGARME